MRKPKKIGFNVEENHMCSDCRGVLFLTSKHDNKYEYCRACGKNRKKRTK